MADAGMPITANPAIRVKAKNYADHEASELIRSLITTTWDSALDLHNNDTRKGRSVDGSSKIKDKCIGVLDVTMEDQTHLYIVACSSTGWTDMVIGKETKFAGIWKGCKERISKAIKGVGINYIIADVGPSTQCYRTVPATRAVSEFDEEKQKAYWDEIEKRMTNHKRELDLAFPLGQDKKLNNDQLEELEEHLKKSVFGAIFGVDQQRSKANLQVIVDWHGDLIENPKLALSSIKAARQSPEEVMRGFCEQFGLQAGQIEKLLKAATDPCPKNEDELVRRLKMLELDKLDEQCNDVLRRQGQYNNSTKDQILQVCQNVCFKLKHSKLADCVAQCAEDNAAMALMEYLEKEPIKKVASVDWFSTEWSESGAVHKPLCGVCAIRFKERLELLLLMSSRDIKYNKIFINNTWHDSTSGDTYPIYNPSTGDKICGVAKGNKEDVDKAVAAAKNVGSMEASKRSNVLNKLADLIERDSVYLAHLEAVNSGRPVWDVSKIDLPLVIKYYRDFAQAASQSTDKPMGIEGYIIPGDMPLVRQAWVLGSTLCLGNTVILKPAEQTPLTSLYFASLTAEAGFPPGVVSIVPSVGPTVSDAMATHPGIIFKGQPKVHKCSIIICADADLDDAIKNSLFIIDTSPEGQYIRTHTYVQESIYDEFVSRSVKMAKMIKVGNPLDPANDWGPLVGQDQLYNTVDLIKSAVKEGAKLEYGGERHGDQGYFIEPTILSDVMEDMKIAQEETFGPVMLIMKYKTNEDVARRTNNPIYDCDGVLCTRNLVLRYEVHDLQSAIDWMLR